LKVIYVAGWGRSGSTLLSLLLAQSPDVVWAGELQGLWVWSDGRPEDMLCGCGRGVGDCPFWRAVLADGLERVDPKRATTFDRRVGRGRNALPGLRRRAGSRLRRDPLVLAHLDTVERLYHSVAREAGARVVVDSSHAPAYARALASVPSLDVRVVHLVRDPRGSAFSWRKQQAARAERPSTRLPRHGLVASGLLWSSLNLATEHTARADGLPYLRVRYEDLVVRPQAVLRSVSAFAGIADSELALEGDRVAIDRTQHSIFGNPLRFATSELRIRLDDEWHRSMHVRDRLTATALALPLLRRYGYPVRG
jgi:hypothetical protein